MLTRLRLKNFKGFQNAELSLGPLTLLVGANASGKSNVRDALRFLHGIGEGYSLPDIIGAKYTDGGSLQWRGIRGGTKEISYAGRSEFEIEVELLIEHNQESLTAQYSIVVDTQDTILGPFVVAERLSIVGQQPKIIFDAKLRASDSQGGFSYRISSAPSTSIGESLTAGNSHLQFLARISLYKQVKGEKQSVEDALAQEVLQNLSRLKFLDLDPEATRIASLPGQRTLGDRGENLSSVLQQLCQNPVKKQILLEWLQELTPMDAVDLEFPSDFSGKVLITLVEANGQRISANSASDGTLRFLAMLAALLSAERQELFFLEELDNGIHPARLNLLLQLIEQKAAAGSLQVIATTHSPQLLRLLSPQSLEFASVTYRLPNHPDAQIKRILEIPGAKQVLEQNDIARLHESGWLENALFFTDDEENSAASRGRRTRSANCLMAQ